VAYHTDEMGPWLAGTSMSELLALGDADAQVRWIGIRRIKRLSW